MPARVERRMCGSSMTALSRGVSVCARRCPRSGNHAVCQPQIADQCGEHFNLVIGLKLRLNPTSKPCQLQILVYSAFTFANVTARRELLKPGPKRHLHLRHPKKQERARDSLCGIHANSRQSAEYLEMSQALPVFRTLRSPGAKAKAHTAGTAAPWMTASIGHL